MSDVRLPKTSLGPEPSSHETSVPKVAVHVGPPDHNGWVISKVQYYTVKLLSLESSLFGDQV